MSNNSAMPDTSVLFGFFSLCSIFCCVGMGWGYKAYMWIFINKITLSLFISFPKGTQYYTKPFQYMYYTK